MTGHQVVKRLKAFKAGGPLPLGETLRIRILEPSDTLILSFVRMGGESAPWGIAYGMPGKAPTILTVPEPRNRDFVAEMMAEFAPVLLKHLQHPEFGGTNVVDADGLAARQVWMPNAAHLQMLQNLAYTYTFTKFGSAGRYTRLNQLGRAAGWLFRESQRPGQTAVMVATDVLTNAYTFPAEDIRQGHLGFLMAWLQTSGSMSARLRAAEVEEKNSISTTLNPEEESILLEPVLAAFNQARSDNDERAQKRKAAVLAGVLRAPLMRRFELTGSAIELLRKEKRRANLGLSILEKATRDEQYRQYLRIERKFDDPEDGPPFVPSPETDRSPAAGASRFFIQEASQELLDGLLVHDDRELQDEMVAEGKALRGRIMAVADKGVGRKTVPVWTLEADAALPLRLHEGSEVCVVGCAKRKGEIRSLETIKGRYRIEVTITSLVTTPRGVTSVLPATSPKLVNQTIMLAPPTKDGIARMKSRKIWNRDVAGRRLTHPMPKGLRNDLPSDVAEQLAGEV